MFGKEIAIIIAAVTVSALIIFLNEGAGVKLGIISEIDRSLIVGITVSIVIPMALLKINKEHRIKTDMQIREIRTIVINQERDAREAKERACAEMLSVLNDMDKKCFQILKEIKTHMGVKSHNNKLHATTMDQNCNYLRATSTKKIDKPDVSLDKYFEVDVIKLLKNISSMSKYYPSVREGPQFHFINVIPTLREKIKHVIDLLSKTLEKKFIINTDRIMYPLGSTVYVDIIQFLNRNRDVIIEVFNEDGKKMIKKKIRPIKNRSEDKANYIYEISFKMDGKKWKIGERYTVKAVCGRQMSERYFEIDRYNPEIQTDKDNYDLKDSILITVIDANFSKDSKKIQHVGDKYSRLTIWSPHNRIKQYRLIEKNEGSGIFQGRIGIITINNDGSRISIKTENGTIKKTCGKGAEDGYIEARTGDTITISYEHQCKYIEKKIEIN